MTDALITISALNKVFQVGKQQVPVLKHVSCSIHQGEFVVIFGPSGCGKSTLLHSILGLEEPTSGTVSIFGKNIYQNWDDDERAEFRKRHLRMVDQQPNWIKSLTVVENVAFPLLMLGITKEQALLRAMQSLQQLTMGNWADYLPSELSSGQQQKVSLARALITNPEIIIADEPTGNLDFASGEELMKLLVNLTKAQKTVIMVTHDLEYLSYANKAIRMLDGEVVEEYSGPDMTKNVLANIAKKRSSIAVSRNSNRPIFPQKLTIATAIQELRASPISLRSIWQQLTQTFVFVLLLCVFLVSSAAERINRWSLFPRAIGQRLSPIWKKMRDLILHTLDRPAVGRMTRLTLIELSTRNLLSKRNRTTITVGGMAIGIASIVFLVSLGYGLQQLVITRVASLGELKQADVTTQLGSKLRINDQALNEFSQIPNAKLVLPLISVVGTVTYQGSVSDLAVYGVQTNYLQNATLQLLSGKYFDSNQIANNIPLDTSYPKTTTPSDDTSPASPIAPKFGGLITHLQYSFPAATWVRVRQSPETTSPIIGYTKRTQEIQEGDEVYGGSYAQSPRSTTLIRDANGKLLGKWVQSDLLLWKKQACDPKTTGDCETDGYIVLRDANGKQVTKNGYVAASNITLSGSSAGSGLALGLTTDLATPLSNALVTPTLPANDQGGSIPFVQIASLSATTTDTHMTSVSLGAGAIKQAVVNMAMLNILGIKQTEAVGKTFQASFTSTGRTSTDSTGKIQSTPATYTIVGVITGDKTPLAYVPFIDLRSMGLTTYSQARVVVSSRDTLEKVRRQIESKGFITQSVADTVAQINSVFGTAKTVLALLGFVALAIASLGMFNTLTVSLLERTREVGLMKSMGMKSAEVKDLFLTESLVMSSFGGIIGLVLGVMLGKILSITLSLYALSHSVGFIDVSFLPLWFVAIIFLLSLGVGIITGIYPARRATKIPALDALRYE